jgi:hypothetical protein
MNDLQNDPAVEKLLEYAKNKKTISARNRALFLSPKNKKIARVFTYR